MKTFQLGIWLFLFLFAATTSLHESNKFVVWLSKLPNLVDSSFFLIIQDNANYSHIGNVILDKAAFVLGRSTFVLKFSDSMNVTKTFFYKRTQIYHKFSTNHKLAVGIRKIS